MKGNIQRRGKESWRLKFEIGRDPLTGERRTRYKTVRGKRADAERELRAVLFRQDKGVAIDPSNITVAQFIDEWLDDVLATKGAEDSQQWSERVKEEIKKKLLESFRNGKAAAFRRQAKK